MSKHFVAVETATGLPDSGKLFAVDPSAASGIPLPSFKMVSVLPRVGNIIGEGYFVTTSRTGFAWDGRVFQPITPTSLLTYATDAAVYADTGQPGGSYAVSTQTGNLFIMGANGWRAANSRTYQDIASANAETNVNDGQIAWLIAEQLLVVRQGAAWVRVTNTPHVTIGAVNPTNPVGGDINYNPADKTLEIHTGTAWDRVPNIPPATPNNAIPVVENGAWVAKEFNAYADNRYYNKTQIDATRYTKTEVDLKAIGQEYYYCHPSHSASEHLITVSGTNYINEYIIADVFSQQLNNGSPQMYVEFEDGTAIHFGSATNFDHQYHSIQYEAGGVKDSGATFNTSQWARWCYRSVGNYDQASGMPLFCRWTLFNIAGYWQMGFNGNYKSSNGTPMIFGGGLEYNKAAPYRIAKFGIRQFQSNSETRSNGICSIHARVK